MLRRITLSTFLLILFTKTAFSQPDVPVDLLTGRPQVSIPLWNVSYGSLSAPVGLAYTGTGLKVEDTEGTAGMGWNLVASGAVSRELRSLPDDFNGTIFNGATDTRQGWLIGSAPTHVAGYAFSADNATGVCTDEATDYGFLSGYSYTKDSEPDFFSVNAPGLSARFVFGTDKLPKTVPYQDLKIEFIQAGSGQITSFTITKNDGTRYFFSGTETVVRQSKLYAGGTEPNVMVTNRELFKKPTTYFSQWKLTRIVSPMGGEINFVYSGNPEATSKKDVEIWEVPNPSSPPSTIKKLYFLEDRITTSNLTSINTDATEVTFEWQRPTQVVTKIVITDKVHLLTKNFFLTYANIKYSGDVNNSKLRLFLKAINEQNSTCLSFPAYKFEYYDVTYNVVPSGVGTTTIPFNSTKQKQDFWGYFNAAALTKLPSVYYYSFKSDGERYRNYSIPATTPTATLNGAYREVNPTAIVYGALKKIIYPTGGSVTITYSPNQYHDAETSTSQYGPGIRVSQVQIDEGITGAPPIIRTYEYLTAAGLSSGKFTNKPTFAFHNLTTLMVSEDNLVGDSELLYERVKVILPGRGYTVYDYDLPQMFPSSTAPTWVKIARSGVPSCTALGQVKPSYYSYPFVPSTNYDIERGFIRFITDYNQSGQVMAQKEYTYQWLPMAGMNVYGVRFEKLGADVYVSGKYLLRTGTGRTIQTEINRVADMATVANQLTTTSTYTYGATHNLLTSVTKVNSDLTSYKTKFKYTKDYTGISATATDVYVAGLKKRQDDFMHGLPVETINSSTTSGVETFTGATLTLYKVMQGRALPAQMLVYNGTTGFAEAALSGTGTAQIISRSAYRPSAHMDEYDAIGNLIAMHDVKLNRAGTLFGYYQTLPVLTIVNAQPSEVVFSNFETPTGRELLPSTSTSVEAYSGRKSAVLGTLSQTVLKGKGNKYRYSFQIKGASNATITLSLAGGTGLPTTVNSYTTVNQWKSFDGIVNVTNANSTFTVTLTASTSVYVDDFAFYPEVAEISMKTYDPLYGATSETNTRNQASLIAYDELGRLREVRDQDKVVRQTTDYKYTAVVYPALQGMIIPSVQSPVAVGTAVSFTTQPGCAQSPTYKWFVDNVQVSTAQTFQYTSFNTEKKYPVRLETTDPVLGSTVTQIEIDVQATGSGPVSITSVVPTDNMYSYSNCDGSSKTFLATLAGNTINSSISWYYHSGYGNVDESMGNWTPVTGANGTTLAFDPKAVWSGVDQNYSILCKVDKSGDPTVKYVVNITYTPGQPCY